MCAPHSPARVSGTFNAHFGLTARERADLARNGASDAAIDGPDPIRGGHVVWSPDGLTFDLEQHVRDLRVKSERAFLILLRDLGGSPADIAAWSPLRDRIGTWRGIGWALGQGDALAPRLSEHGELPVWRSPLAWLAADRRGLVIINAKRAAAILADASPLVAENAAHGRELRVALARPAPRILIPNPGRRAAA